jgi:hypothetical protein
MLPTKARVGHLATTRARSLHAYMSHGYVPGPCNCPCPGGEGSPNDGDLLDVSPGPIDRKICTRPEGGPRGCLRRGPSCRKVQTVSKVCQRILRRVSSNVRMLGGDLPTPRDDDAGRFPPYMSRYTFLPLKISNVQRLVSPHNSNPNTRFYLTLPFQQRTSISSLFHCACAFTSQILSCILLGLDIAPFPLGLRPPILKRKIILTSFIR